MRKSSYELYVEQKLRMVKVQVKNKEYFLLTPHFSLLKPNRSESLMMIVRS